LTTKTPNKIIIADSELI